MQPEKQNIRSALNKVPLSSLTQELGSLGTIELDGCASDLLGALHVTDPSQFERTFPVRCRCRRGVMGHRNSNIEQADRLCQSIAAKQNLPCPELGLRT